MKPVTSAIPLRFGVVHTSCSRPAKRRASILTDALAEQLRVDRTAVDELYCSCCGQTAAVAEFTWLDGTQVGS
jgi:hypothetical protein